MTPTNVLVDEHGRRVVTVGDLVKVAMEHKGMSTREVAAATDGRMSHSQISRILRGEIAASRPRTLRALGYALDIPIEQLREANGADGRVPKPFVLPERANELTVAERRVIVNMIGALLAAHDSQPK